MDFRYEQPFTMRELAQGDEKLVNDFFDAMGGESRSLFNRNDINRRGVLRQCANPDPTRRFWLAIMEERIIGYVFLSGFNTGIPGLGIAVHEDLKGKHLGGCLMDFAIDQAKRAGKGGIRLITHIANLRGQALYESRGFQCMGTYKNGMELFYLLTFTDSERQ